MPEKLNHTRRAEYVTIWWTLLGPGGVLVTIYYSIIAYFEPIAQYGWSGVALAAIILALFTILVASGGALVWRYLRPLPPHAASPASSDAALPVLDHTEMDQVRGQVAALTEKVAEKEEHFLVRLGTVDRDLRKLLDRVDDRLGELAGQLDKIVKLDLRADKVTQHEIGAASAAAKGARDYAEGANHSVSAAQGEALKEQREFQKRMETWVGNLQRKLRYGLASIDHAHAAILDRENMKKLLVQIEEVREELSGPTDRQEPIGDMNAWLAKYGGWYRNVEAWARLGEKYRLGTIKRVFAITNSDYEGDWEATDDLFQDSKAVHKYKTFRIYSRNFFAELDAVERCVEQAAFVHPSQRPQPVLDEEDDDDQPYIPPPPPKV